MKRLVDYADDEDDEVIIPPPPSFTSQRSGPIQKHDEKDVSTLQAKKQAAQQVFIEQQAFDTALYRSARSQDALKQSPAKSKVTERSKFPENVGKPQEDGPWAPVMTPNEEPLITAPYKSESVEAVVKPTIEDVDQEIVSNRGASLSNSVERHGTVLADYQGRKFSDTRRWPPPLKFFSDEEEEDLVEEEEIEKEAGDLIKQPQRKRRKEKVCRLPSLSPICKRTFLGHTKGITKVRVHGCLAITSGMDGAVIVWDTSMPDDIAGATKSGLADETGAIQTYWGHDGRAVRDCAFQNRTPQFFASCGFDGSGVLWDTETGKIVNRYKSEAPHVPVNAVQFKSDDDNQVVFAFGDRRLRHWDIRESGDKPAQTYDFHQSSVHSVLFCEHGNKFVSTGEDRKLLVWEWSVPTPVKIISELWIPGMPTVAAHPNSMSFLSVGLDNRLFQFRVQKQTGVIKKSGECSPDQFRVAGFACEPDYTACGTHFACGDSSGNIHFFRTKAAFASGRYTTQMISGAHMSGVPVSSVKFHPCFDGVLLSASWDGRLKWWS